ncbi:hypothetical protein IHE55_02360 [Streptomyces pactum]|uniref:Uncharacterized protein n=1 Tax=Streptomyces pactum TaxID=68249 RepID=A0ABS0NEX9_9ACTN|nr:hypothetical protein [Streptomyces pactum]MBH5333707.1 hypothetical protein [Streptomyces pactum]
MTTTDFADEARSRVVGLLRMARADDTLTRIRIRDYADSTPDPPVMGRDGIQTRGCGRCRRTMWRQRDAAGLIWVCAACGQVEEDGP